LTETYLRKKYIIGSTGLLEIPMPIFRTFPDCGEDINESEISFSLPGLTTLKDNVLEIEVDDVTLDKE